MSKSNTMIQNRSTSTVKRLGKRKRFSPIAVGAITALILALGISQELIGEHKYPQDAFSENSNLSIRGVVSSIEENTGPEVGH